MTDRETEIVVPQEIIDEFEIAASYETMIKKCVKIPLWGFKKAVKCSRLHQKHLNNAWGMVTEIYPALSGKYLAYDRARRTVTEIEKGS